MTFLFLGVCDPPCIHGACVSDNNCSCSEGFRGQFCEIEGELVKTIHGIQCVLFKFPFFHVVFEECENDVCENGATCKQLAGDYICECPPQYVGAFCEEEGKKAYLVNKFNNLIT